MRILLVDDDPLSRESVADFLEEQLGHEVVQHKNGKEAFEAHKEIPFPLVISDIRMPGLNGIELLSQIKMLPDGKDTDIVLITGYADVNSAVMALRKGAYDYLQKPVNVDELAAVVEKIVEHQSLLKENRKLSHNFHATVERVTRETELKLKHIQSAYAEIVGVGKVMVFSDQMRSAIELAHKLHEDPTVPVLIEGETGTGKEIIARLVHYDKGYITTPFITINCSAISPNLFESELFGYEEGAFTDARKKGMMGKFELAQGGSLFLDEIGDLPLDMQPKLLRAIQEREIYRIGGLKKIKLDVRIICATNKDLGKKVEEKSFRQDLYYRLDVGKIYIPPLKDRKEAIVPLAQMFLKDLSQKKKKGFKYINKEARTILINHDWKGNIRELQNSIERVVLLYNDTEIRAEHLTFLTSDDEIDPYASSLKLGHVVLPPDNLDMKSLEREVVRKALKKFNGNKTKTSEYLGITRSALRSRLDE